MVANVSHIAEGGEYGAQNLNLKQMFNRRTIVHFSTKSATFGNMLLCAVFLHKSIIMNWKRYRLKTYAVSDNRPLIFNPKYPWWCSGYGEDDKGEYSVIIAYLPKDEDLLKYWDDAFDVEFTEEEIISFSDRFPKPSYFVS